MPKPLSPRAAEVMERRAAHGPGARNRMLPCFRRQGACVIFGPVAWRRPGRFTRAPGGTVSSAGGRGAEKLAVPTSPVPVRQQVPVSRPATGEASRNAPDPGVSPRAIPLDRPPPPLRCLDPQPLSCDGDGERLAHRRARSGRTVGETVGVLKGLGNSGAGFISAPFDPSSSSGSTRGSVRPDRRP